MRKTIAVLALMLLCGQVGADVAVRTGSVTLANIRISALANTAFVDFNAFGVLTQLVTSDNRYRIKITDSANKSIEGYPKAAGTGETSVDAIMGNTRNGNMETGNPPTGWGTYQATLSRVADERTGGTGTYSVNVLALSTQGYGVTTVPTVKGRLYEFGGWIKNIDSVSPYITRRGHRLYSNSTNWTFVSIYFVGDVDSKDSQYELRVNGDTGKSARFDDVFERYITAPSATGVTIVSTRGGSTQSWASQESGFNYNDASGYTYTVYREIPYTMQNPAYQMPRFK